MIGRPTKTPVGGADSDIKYWLHNLDRGIKRREKELSRWDHNESYENLQQWSTAVDGAEEFIQRTGVGDEVTVNKVGSYIQNNRASLSFKNPRVKLTPETPAGYDPIAVPEIGTNGQPKLDEFGQVVVREVIPYKAKEMLVNKIVGAPAFGLRDTITRLTKAGDIAYGALFVGYRPEFSTPIEKETEQKVPIVNGQMDFSSYVMNPITGLPQTDDSGRLIKKSAIPVNEEWQIDWQSYRSVIIDPDGKNDFLRHSWVAVEEVRSLEEVKNDPLFKNTDNLEATGESDDWEDAWDSALSDLEPDLKDQIERVRLFHIWDMDHGEYIVLADGHDDILRREPTPDGVEGNPLAFYRPNELLDEFYPRPKVSDLAPLNDEYNIARTQQLRAMKKSNRKIFARDGALDTLAMSQLKSDEDMAVINVKELSTYSIDKVVYPFGTPPVNEALYSNIKMISMDFDEMAGQPGEARGTASADTATQVNAMSKYTGIRQDFTRQCLVDTLTMAFTKLIASIDANMRTERAIELIGTDGQTFHGLLDVDMISCPCTVSVDVQDMAPVNEGQEAALRVQALQVAAQAPWMVATELGARSFCELLNIKDENFIKGLAQGAQMQMQMLASGPQGPGGGDKSPEAGPPQSEAEAAMKTGAGTQVQRMSGAK